MCDLNLRTKAVCAVLDAISAKYADVKHPTGKTCWYEVYVNMGEDRGTKPVARGKRMNDVKYFIGVASLEELIACGLENMHVDIMMADNENCTDVFRHLEFSNEEKYQTLVSFYKGNNLLWQKNRECRFLDGKIVYDKGYGAYNDGYFFKDEILFEYFMTLPYYAAEFADDDIEEGDEPKNFDTRQSILECCGQNTSMAEYVFREVDWQFPSTLVNELDAENFME